jgi:predicted phage-related endonuclease
MREWIERYVEVREKVSTLQKEMDELKEKIKNDLKNRDQPSYSKNGCEAVLKESIRSTMNKKDVPSDVWEKYSTSTKIETLYIKKA